MDMEVAGQWRREWAGSAEYGKVTEGGVTRRIARAMEVLHASAPGARVRVLRAAYHSSAGPGTPASSYLMHSSRQVISSGYNFLEPTPIRSQPLEISSTPLESSPESEVERENYKVTEPDDYEISEPSKWRASSGKNSIRMPSEDSSSTDNASIIDLDSRINGSFKRTLESKHSDDNTRTHIINTRVSPLLDAPVALSTLKYTSILNGSDEWNNRRKSYSFEDTSPLDQNAFPQNNSHTIDSSTDSGICKSTEIVDDSLNKPINRRQVISNERSHQDELTFKQWLSRNRYKSYRDTSTPPPRSYRKLESPPIEGKIALQSSGKVSITLPFETQKSTKSEKSISIDDNDRRAKRVEFCKTELHFAVDTGTVNIIATDEKPPPSNDFRRKRSAFVPLNTKVDKPITLLGEKTEFSESNTDSSIPNDEFVEFDETTAATKSILKNKIPKPKPYLLGENMILGNTSDDTDNLDLNRSLTKTSAVSLINSQLQSDSRYSNETISSGLSDDSTTVTTRTHRTGSQGPQERHINPIKKRPVEVMATKSQNKKLNSVPSSSEMSKTKIRELRGRDLAYFGIENNETPKYLQSQDNIQEEIFHSVKLVQQVSNSVCNSEAESDDAPEYQNVKFNFNKVPTPSPRTKFDKETNKLSEHRVLKPISEQYAEQIVLSGLRSNSLRRQKESSKQEHLITTGSSKSKEIAYSIDSNDKRNSLVSPGKTGKSVTKIVKGNKENQTFNVTRNAISRETETPLYVNINIRDSKEKHSPNSEHSSCRTLRSINTDPKVNKQEIGAKSTSPIKKNINIPKEVLLLERKEKKYETKESQHRSQKNQPPRRTEKLATPDITTIPQKSSEKTSKEFKKVLPHNSHSTQNKLQRNESLRRNKAKIATKVILEDQNILNKRDGVHNKDKDTVKSVKAMNGLSTLHENKTNSKSSKNTILSHKTNKISDIKLDMPAKPKRSKYVINYDDKNGTVSSICKIKKGPGTYKRKVLAIENKNLQDSNTKDKSLNKIALRK